MDIKTLHELYHSEAKLQKRIISSKNFTYRTTISIIEKYLKKGDRILDIGCGVGTIDFYFAKMGFSVFGVDISEKAIMLARENTKKFRFEDKINFKKSNFPDENLSGRYNIVILSEVIEHLRNDKKAIQRVHEVLKSNGILIISTPSETAPLHRLGLTKRHDKRVGHLRRYSLNKLKTLLGLGDFETLDTKKTEGAFKDFLFVFPNFGRQIVRIANKFDFISDVLTLIDNMFLEIFGESQIFLISKRK